MRLAAQSADRDPGEIQWLRALLNEWVEFGGRAQIQLELHNDLSPWESQTYLLRQRGGALASLTLRFADPTLQAVSRVALLSDETWAAAAEQLLPCAADFGLPSLHVGSDPVPVGTTPALPPAWERVTRQRWTFRFDGEEHTVTWEAPFEDRQQRCMETFRSMFHVAAGPVEIAWPWVDPATWGTFQSHTPTPARVWVDDWPTGMVTPVDRLPLPAGTHEVVWRDVRTGEERRETVRIEAGRVTRMDVSVP
jgi:hypothetical protein